jgi:hypothetical protein
MSCRFVDSFSHYATADISKKWNDVGPGGTVAIIDSVGRFSGNAIRVDPLAVNAWVSRTIDAQQIWTIGFAMLTPGLPATTAVLCQLIDGANGVQCDLRVNPDGTLSITRNGTALVGGTSTVAIRIGAWNYIEFHAKISQSTASGDGVVQLNSAQVLSINSGQSLQSTSDYTANEILIAGAFAGCLFNDCYMCDGNGSVNNTFLNDIRVIPLFPNGAGALTQFSVTGASTNWQAVSENPPDNDLTYVSSNTPGNIDLYTVNNLTTAGTINAIQTVIDTRKDNSASHTLAAEIRIGGTNYSGTSVPSASSYVFNCEIRETNPFTSVAWTQADINTPLQIGLNLVS